MRRQEALKTIYPLLKDQIVVTNMGAVAVELYNLGHQPSFFYLEHSMGLASSVGLGLALCLPDHRVSVLDGDASVLMNLGTLSTMARYRPPEFDTLDLRQRELAFGRRFSRQRLPPAQTWRASHQPPAFSMLPGLTLSKTWTMRTRPP